MALLAIWMLASIWFGSDSGISVPGLLVIIDGAALLLLAWLIIRVVSWKRNEAMKLAWLEPVAAALMLAAIYSGALFDLRFVASRRALDRYVAQTLAAGESNRKATIVGLFVARETEVLPKNVVRIITTSCMFDDCGVVFSRTKPPIVGEDRYHPLATNWWKWWRSW